MRKPIEGLPITIALNHAMLGMDENSICQACKEGRHQDCNLATWCMCDDDCDGDPDCFDAPFDDLP